MLLTADLLSSLSEQELISLYREMETPTEEEKQKALNLMDTGIYDVEGNLIGDKSEAEDTYEE